MSLKHENSVLSLHMINNNFICLKCNATHPDPEHGKEFDCSCGISYISYGNKLEFLDKSISEYKKIENDDDPIFYKKNIVVNDNYYNKKFYYPSNLKKEEWDKEFTISFRDCVFIKELSSRYIEDFKIKLNFICCPHCSKEYYFNYEESSFDGFYWNCSCNVFFEFFDNKLTYDLTEEQKIRLKVKIF